MLYLSTMRTLHPSKLSLCRNNMAFGSKSCLGNNGFDAGKPTQLSQFCAAMARKPAEDSKVTLRNVSYENRRDVYSDASARRSYVAIACFKRW
jgi:hypothetical protein